MQPSDNPLVDQVEKIGGIRPPPVGGDGVVAAAALDSQQGNQQHNGDILVATTDPKDGEGNPQNIETVAAELEHKLKND